jgi:hypothetical protein
MMRGFTIANSESQIDNLATNRMVKGEIGGSSKSFYYFYLREDAELGSVGICP